MERVVYIERFSDLEDIEISKYKRIYIGADSCPNLMPTFNELEKYIDFAKENNLKISFLTSFCFDVHIDRFRSLLPLLVDSKEELDIEIVINDWGIFQLVKELGFKLVLGRLLTKQKKGPRVENIKESLNESALFAYREVPSAFYEQFLLDNNFVRIELDNIPLGIEYNGKIPASIYYPYIFVSPSSLCMYFGKVSNKDKVCARECLSNVLVLEGEDFKRTQYRKGNSYFYKNKDLPNEKNLNVNRIVMFRRV